MSWRLSDKFQSLKSGEEFIRSKSVEAIAASNALQAHLEMIESAMDALNYFVRVRKADDDNELTLQLLGIRLFNATACAFTLGLTGYYQKSALVQRDILETIFLLDYLTTDVGLIAAWKAADRKTRMTKFKPSFIRKTLDGRDGYNTRKRDAAYDLLSELGSHATYKGFTMLAAVPGGSAHCGPFFEVTALDAVISELAKQAAQVMRAFMHYFATTKRADVEVKLAHIEHQRRWATKFLGAVFDDSDLERMRAELARLP